MIRHCLHNFPVCVTNDDITILTNSHYYWLTLQITILLTKSNLMYFILSFVFSVICHAVFGISDENIVSCCRNALEIGYKQNYETIVSLLRNTLKAVLIIFYPQVFWIEGFVSACVSPYLIVGTVREWLEESDNRLAFTQIVFAIPSSPAIFNLIERYFPLKDYERQKAIEVSSVFCLSLYLHICPSDNSCYVFIIYSSLFSIVLMTKMKKMRKTLHEKLM